MPDLASTTKRQPTSFLTRLTDNFKWQSYLPKPTDLPGLRKSLSEDLASVPVMCDSGEVRNVYEKIDGDKSLSREDKELIWNCLAIVRDMYWRLEQADQLNTGYQWNMNWKHTRAELDQVYDAANILKLNALEKRDALLASIFSDAIKSRGNFIIHNVHGAEAAALAMSYFLDPSKDQNKKSMERVSRACKEHQIAPPKFMATIVSIMLHNKLKLGKFDPVIPAEAISKAQAKTRATVQSLYNKISTPFDETHLNDDLSLIVFTPAERELLSELGINDWYIPHPSNPKSKIASAVIAGDHSINYNHPEGFAKIALLRGPDTESIFEDPTIHHSLDSAVASFNDSFSVIRPEVRGMSVKGLRRTTKAVQRVTMVMTELFNSMASGPRKSFGTVCGYEEIESAIARAHKRHPELYSLENCAVSSEGSQYVEEALERVGKIMADWYRKYSEIPFSPKDNFNDRPGCGPLPFWNSPLIYPERDSEGKLVFESLNELQSQQFLFADRIREITVELLRAEQWIFSIEAD